MEAGKLTRRVRIEAKGQGTDAWGQPLPDVWTPVCEVWASIKNLSGLGTIRAQAETSIVKASIRIRWRTDVKAGMRVLASGAVYAIEAVLPDLQRREFVDLVARREG